MVYLPIITGAQTINQVDLPTVRTAFSLGIDTNYTGVIPLGGQNQTWNLSTLHYLYADTTVFINPAGTPYAANFPNSNVAGVNLRNNSYSYFINDPTGFYLNGVGTQNTVIPYNPPLLYIPVPFSYGDSRTDEARIQKDTTSGGQNYRIVEVIDANFKADGTGSLTIPSGTYQNVLRFKVTVSTYDSIFVETIPGNYTLASSSFKLSYHYRWVTSGSDANYLLGLDADQNGAATKSEFLLASGLGLPKITENKSLVSYPNPVINILNFKNISSNSSIVIYDNSGKVVLKSMKIVNNSLNVELLKNGIYHYEILTNDNLLKGNFVVQH